MANLNVVKPYFRTHLNVLKFKEHTDGFNTKNIPDTLLDRSYHILTGSVQGGPVNFTHQSTEVEVTVLLYFKGFRKVDKAIDIAMNELTAIITECCKIKNRSQTGAGVFNVVFDRAEITPFDDKQNVNTAILQIDFKTQVLIGIEE